MRIIPDIDTLPSYRIQKSNNMRLCTFPIVYFHFCGIFHFLIFLFEPFQHFYVIFLFLTFLFVIKTTLSVIFQLYYETQFWCVSRYPENHVYLWQDTDKLYHRKLYLVHLAIIVIRTHNLK